MKIHLVSLAAWLCSCLGMISPAEGATENVKSLQSVLAAQGVPAEAITGVDRHGIPSLCGTREGGSLSTQWKLDAEAAALALPLGTRAYEVIPTVVRSDGKDSFRLEVNANGSVASVRLEVTFTVVSASGGDSILLRDDGLGGDRAAGDFIFTSELLHHNTALFGQPGFFLFDTNSPKGLDMVTIGELTIVENSGVTNRFLVSPTVGILHTNIPAIASVSLASNVIASPHVLNIRSSRLATQRFMRYLTSPLEQLTSEFYSVLPDAYDFLFLFSIDHIEKLPWLDPDNFIAGIHTSAQVKFSGTGQGMYDLSSFYGSAGRLQGINILDTLERGIYSQNATHELLHQWCAYLSFDLGLNEDSAHFSFRSSVGSLVGGFHWIDNGNGSFIVDCNDGRSGAYFASPLDKYMMGLIEGNQVPVLHAFSNSIPTLPCDGAVSNVPVTVSITDIQQRHGVRAPAPAAAQRKFSMGFLAESHDRLLTPTEMTFYDILARQYSKPLAVEAPAPKVEFNWVPIGKFFGEGTTWTSHHGSLVTPTISVQPISAQQHRIFGKGFPGQTYVLERTSNLIDWTPRRTTTPAADGRYELVENTANAGGFFYRLRW